LFNIPQVIELINDDELLNKETLDEYLTDEFVPYVTSFYDVTVQAHTSLDEIFQLLVQAITKKQLDKREVNPA
jgi:hypothetical protein